MRLMTRLGFASGMVKIWGLESKALERVPLITLLLGTLPLIFPEGLPKSLSGLREICLLGFLSPKTHCFRKS